MADVVMKKTLGYRWFGFGRLPREARKQIDSEGDALVDEGLPGWMVTEHLDAPGKRFRKRAEGFSGALAVTDKRVLLYTYRKRQIHIAADDPALAELHADLPERNCLVLSFESARFRPGWRGVIEFRLGTERAEDFHHRLIQLGVQPGLAMADKRPPTL